jgi:hypothetical protein
VKISSKIENYEDEWGGFEEPTTPKEEYNIPVKKDEHFI